MGSSNLNSRREIVKILGLGAFYFPFTNFSLFEKPIGQEYHFAQPSAGIPSKIFEPNEAQLGGFQAVAWNTPLNNVVVQQNSVSATVTTSGGVFNPSTDSIATVQFQQWWGRGNGIKPWDGTKYGYDVNNVKLSFGAMVKVPQNTGNAIGYATFYLRGEQVNKANSAYWIQISLFDERGYNSGNQDNIYFDQDLTNEPAIETQIGQSAYSSINPDSNILHSTPFSNYKFFGASISRQQLYNMMVAFQGAGFDISPEPNLHRIFAFGITPELGNAQPGGTMQMDVQNLFLRTDY